MALKIQGIAADIDNLTLRGKKWRANVTDAVIDASVSRTMAGASTLDMVVADPDRDLINSQLLRSQFDVKLDDNLFFRFVGVADGGGAEVTLRFESREVARLRIPKGPRKAYRDRVTRAEFARALVHEVRPRIPFYCPVLRKTQPIRNSREGRRNDKDSRREPGLDAKAKIKVKGKQATRAQISNIDRVLDVGRSVGAAKKVLVAAVMTVTQESNAMNMTGGDRDSTGLFQQRRSQGWPATRDIERDANAFYKGAGANKGALHFFRQNPGWGPGRIAQAVQKSGHPRAYDQWQKEAETTVAEYLGSEGGVPANEKYKRYAFERGRHESTWECLGRLAEEVNWRCFESAGTVLFIPEPTLLSSRVRMRIRDDAPGLDPVSFDYDSGQPVNEVTVTGRARFWAAPPGTIVTLEGRGPADGRYLVNEISSSLFGPEFSATLRRVSKPLPEPEPEEASGSDGSRSVPKKGGTGSARDLDKIRLESSYSGTESIFVQFVDPFMADRGLRKGSRKRPTKYTSSGNISAHWVGNNAAFACDYPTTNGEAAARALAKALGFGGWQPNSYKTFTRKIDGKQFSFQILWGAKIAHADHVHVAAQRI